MPMSPHRPALAGILLAFVAVLGLAPHVQGATASQVPVPELITRTALKYEGTYQGDCWPFVQRVVLEASGRKIGFDYRAGFFEAGAVEVKAANAQAGDIIQVADDNNTAPDADYPGLHTVIVLENLGNGVFSVVDSNSQWDGVVRRRPAYEPGSAAARYGLNYHVYRLAGTAEPATSPSGSGGSTSTKPAAAPPVAPFEAGDTAKVAAQGDCLNLRWAPGTSNAVVACIPDGVSLKVLSAPQTAEGHQWVKVLVNGLQGYVAAEFLERTSAPAAPASSSSPGGQAPVLPFRAFAAGLMSSD